MKKILLLLIISMVAMENVSAYCYPDASCEEDLQQLNKQALKKIDKKFDNTKGKLDDLKDKYDKINNELKSNIETLKTILSEEVMVNGYLDKILFEAKRQRSIEKAKQKKD